MSVLCAFILYVDRGDGLIPHPRSTTGRVSDQETEKVAKANKGLQSHNNNNNKKKKNLSFLICSSYTFTVLW
jgi:ATP-dependent helicase/DNAse subunit B